MKKCISWHLMIKSILKIELLLLIFVSFQSIYAKGWKQDSVGWRYENSDGSYVTSSYRNSGSHKMYLNENGYVATLYYLVDKDKSYFFDKDGYKMKYGCAIIGTSTKSNIRVDKNYILYFITNGEVFIKNELPDG